MLHSAKLPISEEKMAAYLDGMLKAEAAMMVGLAIVDNSELLQIQDSIDDVDTLLLTENNDIEIPAECMSDDFELPFVIDMLGYASDADINLFEEHGDYNPDHHSDSSHYHETGAGDNYDYLEDPYTDNQFVDDAFGFDDDFVCEI